MVTDAFKDTIVPTLKMTNPRCLEIYVQSKGKFHLKRSEIRVILLKLCLEPMANAVWAVPPPSLTKPHLTAPAQPDAEAPPLPYGTAVWHPRG